MQRATTSWSQDFDIELGARIRARRSQLGLTQRQLGDALGVTFQQLQKYERGANRISAFALVTLAATLSVSVVELLPATKQ